VLGGAKTSIDPTGIINQRNKTDLFYSSWNEFYGSIDQVQVSAHWLFDLLVLNGVPREKIRYIELGGRAPLPSMPRTRNPGDPLKLVFMGRCSSIKGIDVLIDAVLQLPPELPLEVYFYGPGWNDTEYGLQLQARMAGDRRFKPPQLFDPENVINAISKMDACVIPSRWPETGPIVVFDAFAAGIPVIGTDYAGIRERVRHGVDGLLFAWNDSHDLARQLRSLAENPAVLERLRGGVTPKRTFAEFAEDMHSLYKNMLRPASL
jgi:glycosyltransferase involved in cell wall biosynthesis